MSAVMRPHGGMLISISFLVALVLLILPLPPAWRIYRPDWVLLALIYWNLALPHRVGVGIGWTSGLLEDVLTGTVLGQHALANAVVAYLTLKLHLRVRRYPRWQQTLTVLVLLTLAQLLSLWINGIMGLPVHAWSYWTPALTGALLWPPVYRLLRGLRRHYRIG